MHIHTYIYTHIYIYIYVHIHIHAYTYTHVHSPMCTQTDIFYMDIDMYNHLCTCSYSRMHECIYIHWCMHKHNHVHTLFYYTGFTTLFTPPFVCLVLQARKSNYNVVNPIYEISDQKKINPSKILFRLSYRKNRK